MEYVVEYGGIVQQLNLEVMMMNMWNAVKYGGRS